MNLRSCMVFGIYASGALGSSCDMHQYCRTVGGVNSYCKSWQPVSSCFGADTFKNCVTCGGTVGTVTTKAPSTTTKLTTKAPTTTTKVTTKSPITTTVKTTTNAPTLTTKPGIASTVVTTTASPVTYGPLPATVAAAGCAAGKPQYAAPLFLWVELATARTQSEFVDFYQKLGVFLTNNCANIRPTTLVIRVINPSFPTAQPMYWPPERSPLYTELISKIKVLGSEKVKILLYPYVMEENDRNKWVGLAQSRNVTPVVNKTMSVYDGIFAFTKAWQNLVAPSSSFSIDGFMIDYEELTHLMGSQNLLSMTPESLTPYRTAYPSIKVATSLGFDDTKHVKLLDPVVDYFHLQFYDLYYPYAGSDASAKDSIFEAYKDNPSALLNVITTNILTPTFLRRYVGFEQKIKLMWSTQTLSKSGCIYPMTSGSCGVNYEINWNPIRFNQLMQMVLAHPQLGIFEHGLYTYNFMRPDWVAAASR